MEAKLSNEQPVELTEQGLESLGFPTTPGSCGYVSHADACAASEGGEIGRVAKTSLENLKLTSHVRFTSILKFLVCLGLVAITVLRHHETFPAMGGFCNKAKADQELLDGSGPHMACQFQILQRCLGNPANFSPF